MPGKHAPSSPASFYLSLARWVALASGAVGVLVAILLVITGGDAEPTLAGSGTPTPKPRATATGSVRAKATVPPVRHPSATTVRVLNGTNKTGLAGRVGDALEEEGYDVVERENGPAGTETTTIFYRSGWLEEAKALRRKHPEMSKLTVAPAAYAKEAAITVLLGKDYP